MNPPFEVTIANDGVEAINKLKNESFDLIIMDLHMPNKDGIETTKEIRAGVTGEKNQEVPIIALTAAAFSEDSQNCLEAGMNRYLTKPTDTKLLTKAIYELLY